MKEISVDELKIKMDKKEDFQLIDVREDFEYEICNLNGELIPMAKIFDQVERISKTKPVIIHCKSGGRSGVVVSELERRFGFTNLYNLKGGILAYAKQIDTGMNTY
jgi:rhodanese-related sulfurtransferase